MSPILFEYGPLRIATYGVMLAIGFLAGLFVLRRELVRKGLDNALADHIVMAAMIGGIVGGKLFHVLEFPDALLADPMGTIFSGSGLAWYGGFLGGTGAVFWTLRRHDALDFNTIDAMAPTLAVGYFFGRGGCQLSGDGCYGIPTDVPWAMTYPHGTVPTHLYVHPTPLYEMLQMVILFAILWSLRKRLHPPGLLFALYLILAGLSLFSEEFVRRTPEVALGLTVHQWVSLALMGIGILLIIRLKRAQEPAEQKA
ncbi:MAG: prolipoprotein diacylglyceryl transferase [bacterium]|nr:prolipoprotein diacylglyceryl transferase [bacterium]